MSLAKLDEVKANVYNLGLADPKQLKATSGNLTVKQVDSINTQPPLSSLVQQRHVWLVSIVQSKTCHFQPNNYLMDTVASFYFEISLKQHTEQKFRTDTPILPYVLEDGSLL